MDLKTCRLITRVLYAACFILILLSLTQEGNLSGWESWAWLWLWRL